MPEQLLFIDLTSADPRERGRQYGSAARELIARSVDFYAELFQRTAGLRWEEATARARAWVPLVDDYLPGILDEIRGIAEGAERDFEEILALNARFELSQSNPFDDKADEGCTSFALLAQANGVGHVLCGQNWDWRERVADTVVVLRVQQPGRPTFICQTEAGQVGRHGANSAGLALNANGLGGGFETGLSVPGTFVRRKILESWDVYDALRAAFQVTQSAPSNLLITHRDGFAIDLETTPGRHGWMYPTDGLLVHGNHFQAFVPPQIEGTYRPFSVDSLFRVPRVTDGLRAARTVTSSSALRAHVREVMSDHFAHPNGVCQHADPRRHEADRYQTVVSSLVDLSTGEYLLTAGLPCEKAYVQAPWNLYDGPAAPTRPAWGQSSSPAPHAAAHTG
ncbi:MULTISPECIES: C45 family autoproteolytic acyltransferase/hydolase [unclassified Streptomyces]|uniref:C45 family autoproteolytic acyltransferase/hydolase n=1 Tax=unclassified Streptomyces TaxID=2593676 RepID=UPI0007C64496|nr:MULTISPECIES: C45 family peptidase [unclassified Streptomyces]